MNTNNEMLAHYVALKTEIARLEKQLAPIKEQIEMYGSFETNQFIVKVDQVETNRVCGADELLLKVGFVQVNNLGLIKTSTYNKVTVKPKLAAFKAA